MSNYTKITDYAAKDLLLHGDAAKAIKGTEVGAEFDAIATMSATKVDSGGALGTPSSGTLTNCTGLPISTGVSGLGTGVATFLATPSSANLASAVTGETGSGALVFATSPALVTPNIGTPSAGTLTSCTGLPISTGVSGLGTGVATFLATPSSSNLASAVTDETGSGVLVFGTSPTITTPNIVGTSTNNDAAAGSVGEYISSTIASGSAVSLTTATAADVTSISLTAGDWDVSAFHGFAPAVTTNVVFLAGSISTTSATHSASSQIRLPSPSGVVYGGNTALSGATIRISIASTTTIYLVATANFTVSTCGAYGTLSARRVR